MTKETKTKKPAFATNTQTDKAIQIAITEQKSKSDIALMCKSLFKSKVLSGQPKQFEIFCEKLTNAINKRMGWEYRSLNGIYLQGFDNCTYANKCISVLRQLTAIPSDEISAKDREYQFNGSISEITKFLKDRKESLEPANDSGLPTTQSDQAQVVAELAEELEETATNPVLDQVIDKIKHLTQDQLIELNRYLSEYQRKSA